MNNKENIKNIYKIIESFNSELSNAMDGVVFNNINQEQEICHILLATNLPKGYND